MPGTTHPAVLWTAGLAFMVHATSQDNYFYRTVQTGTIVNKDCNLRHNYYRLCLKGLSRAGEPANNWITVTEGMYSKYNIGDYYPG